MNKPLTPADGLEATAHSAPVVAVLRTGPVVLFPGQGAYRAGALHDLGAASADAAEVLREISDAVGGLLDPLIEQPGGRGPYELADENPDLLQLAIFAASVALWTTRRRDVPGNAVLLGHSLGEIAAATCAGAFSISDGARIVQARNTALMELMREAGGLLALGLDTGRARAVIRLVDDPTLAIACRNAPDHTVVAGSHASLLQVEEFARLLGISFSRLAAPFPFHSKRMTPVAARFWGQIKSIRQRPLDRTIYSPIRRRYLSDGDCIGKLLVDQGTVTVDFMDAVRDLHARGARRFIECGALDATVKLVRRTVPFTSCVSWDGESELGRVALLDGPSRPGSDQPLAGDARTETEDPKTSAGPRILESPETVNGTDSRLSVGAVEPVTGDTIDILRALYADSLGYPPEVLDEDADLEADLGVDSLKQTALLARVAARFELSDTSMMRIADFPTLASLAAEVERRRAETAGSG